MEEIATQVGMSKRTVYARYEDKGTLLGEVTGVKGAHGTALAGPSGHGFATSGDDQAVIMFDAKTFKSLKHIPAAEDALR